MIMDKSEEQVEEQQEEMSENNNNAIKNDDHIFLAPISRPQKRCNKKSLTLLGRLKPSCDEAKTKHESNLKHYKLSPQVYGLSRPVSMSTENLSSSSLKKKSLFGSKKKESKNEDSTFSIWGSLQELRESSTLAKQQQTFILDGTYSEPNLNEVSER
jgi:hypothetical protein